MEQGLGASSKKKQGLGDVLLSEQGIGLASAIAPGLESKEHSRGFRDISCQKETTSREPAQGQVLQLGDDRNGPSQLDSLVQTLGGWKGRRRRKCCTRSRFWRMEEDAMEIKLLLAEPKNEEYHLDKCLGGVFDHYTHQMEYEFHSLAKDGGMDVEQTLTNDDIEDYLEPSMLASAQNMDIRPLDFKDTTDEGQISQPGEDYSNEPNLLDSLVLTPGGWRRHGRRKCRTRSIFWRAIFQANISQLFGLQNPFASGGRKNTRKNNPHWTTDEVCMLVDGVSTYGVGRWTEIKTAYFQTSVRTAVHLKDKWKNLKAACGPKVRSKNKIKARKVTRKVIKRLEARIIEACCLEKERPRR